MSFRRIAPVVVLAAVLLAPAAAQASDRQLQRIVVREERQAIPVADRFASALRSFSRNGKPTRLLRATRSFRRQIRGYRHAVTPIRTRHPRAKGAKRRLMKALRAYNAGLRQFEMGTKELARGRSPRRARPNFRSGRRFLRRAGRHNRAALRALNISAG